MKSTVLKGIPASAGIAIGTAFVFNAESPTIQAESIDGNQIDGEITRFRTAQEATTAELFRAIELARAESSTASSIIESYVLIVSDPVMTRSIIDRITHGTPAETAVTREFEIHKAVLYNASDPLLRERAQDFDHVKERIIAALRNRTLSHADASGSIVVSGSITPHDMIFFKQSRVMGYVTEIGGINSHSCILARELSIPAVIGIRNVTDEVHTGTTIIVDGYAGLLIVDPDEATKTEYIEKQRQAEEYRDRLGSLVDKPSETRDKHHIVLKANVDAPEQVDAAVMAGCEGVGLVRTEMLLVQRGRYPSEREQTEWYRDIAQRAFPLPVTFRAFDVGSDKFREGIPHHEDNPALGLRGIRFLLYRPDLFATQISAILRASSNRNIRFMLPMVSSIDELDQARVMIGECMARLLNEGVDFDSEMPLGVMIETPAAALLADSFAQRADFLSIGTNDLAQYALATDRTNELVADIFDAMHPAVVRLMKMTVLAANTAGIPVSVCGELAGHSASTELLTGLGIHELSVAPPIILELKHRIRNVSYDECVDLVQRIENCVTTNEVYNLIGSMVSATQPLDSI